MKLKPVFLFITAMFASAIVTATPVSEDQSGWYLGGAIGRSSNTMPDANFGPDTTKSTKATAYRLHGGYQFNEYLMGEAAYVDFGSLRLDSPDASARIKSRAIMISAIGMLPLSPDFSLLGKVGAAVLSIDAQEAEKSGRWRNQSRAVRTTPFIGVGMRYLITPEFAVRAEYDYLQKVAVFENGNKLANSMMSIGVDYRF